MFLPSNDWFVADQGGSGVDISGLLDGSSALQSISLSTIYDAGTELEDFTRGGGTGADPFNLAPRLSDAEGGNPNDQDDVIAAVQRTPGVNLFADFLNPNGEPIDRFLGASSGSLGTITLTVIAPAEPTTASAPVPQGAVYVQTNALDGNEIAAFGRNLNGCLLYTSPSPRDATLSRMPSSA